MSIKLFYGQTVAYQTDENGFYVGETAADPDPMHPGRWLLPAGCVDVKPPVITGGKVPQWAGWKWKMVEKPE